MQLVHYIRLWLDSYCVQAWHPYLKKNMKALQQVQHRATKMIKGFRNLSYKDRLDELDLLTLEDRYIRGDLIQAFKLIKGIDKTGLQQILSASR